VRVSNSWNKGFLWEVYFGAPFCPIKLQRFGVVEISGREAVLNGTSAVRGFAGRRLFLEVRG
jgi:hypothetical protein